MNKAPSLIFCILMDLIGYLSYTFVIFGELSDIVWGPLSAYLFFKSFGGKTGTIGSLINLAEEVLPFTDFIPTFTLAYFYNSFKKNGLNHKKQ